MIIFLFKLVAHLVLFIPGMLNGMRMQFAMADRDDVTLHRLQHNWIARSERWVKEL